MPDLPRPRRTVRFARSLRARMTIEEKRLWLALRRSRWKFRRQEPIGPYIADFADLPKRLIVEVDGIQHS